MDDEEKELSVSQSAPSSTSLPLTLTLTSVNPITRLLEKRQQLLSVQQSLDQQKAEDEYKEGQFRRREENLRKKDLELQEALVLFNKFLKDNEIKRRRAEQRANEEIKKRLHWEKEIVSRKLVLEGLKKKSEKLKKRVKRNDKYASFLQLVYDDASQPFDELQSIIARYSTLHSTNADLLHSQSSSSTLAEHQRTLHSTHRKAQYNEILQLTNEVATWSAEYERVERVRREVEEGMEVEEAEHEHIWRELIQVVLGTENLHARCKKELQAIRRHGEAGVGMVGGGGGGGGVGGEGGPVGRLEREVEGKLYEIGEYLVDLTDIVESVGGLSMEAGRSRGGLVSRGQRDREREKEKDKEKERDKGGEESKEQSTR